MQCYFILNEVLIDSYSENIIITVIEGIYHRSWIVNV